MNLPPKFADRFLREAMLSVRNGGIVHYYGFGPRGGSLLGA